VHVDWCVYNAGGFSLLPGTAGHGFRSGFPGYYPSSLHGLFFLSPQTSLNSSGTFWPLRSNEHKKDRRWRNDDGSCIRQSSFVPIQSSSFIGLPNDDDSGPKVRKRRNESPTADSLANKKISARGISNDKPALSTDHSIEFSSQISYKRSNAQYQKILRKEKRARWRNLCASFNRKTSDSAMSEIWRFVKAYKIKSLTPKSPSLDTNTFEAAQESALNKLCPSSCLHFPYSSLESLMQEDSSPLPFAWIDDPFSSLELDVSVTTCKMSSFPGLDRFDYRIITALPPDIRIILLNIYNELYENGSFPSAWRDSLMILIPKPSGLRSIALMSCLL